MFLIFHWLGQSQSRDSQTQKPTYNGCMVDNLEQFLLSNQRDSAYRVDAVLKSEDFETTERVFFTGSNGSEQGPYIRKRIKRDGRFSLGSAYERIFEAQQSGKRFLHIPRITDCVSTSEELTVVMELVPGRSLDECGHLGLSDAAHIFERICDAVAELHTQFNPPIIHRDLKPSNIIVSGEAQEIVLIDFGIARSLNKGERADTTHFGTRDYAPPEQYGFAQTDERSDVFALGLILFYLVMGREPAPHERKDGLNASCLPPDLKIVVEKAASFDPSGRYASVAELKAAALIAFSKIKGIRANVFSEDVPADAMPSWSNPLPDNRSLPRKIWGYIRNAAAILVGGAMTICTCWMVVDPSASDYTANAPMLLRAGLYVSFFLVPVLAACVLVSDETPLRRRIPLMAQIKGEREIRFWITLLAASLGLFLFLLIFFLPPYVQ